MRSKMLREMARRLPRDVTAPLPSYYSTSLRTEDSRRNTNANRDSVGKSCNAHNHDDGTELPRVRNSISELRDITAFLSERLQPRALCPDPPSPGRARGLSRSYKSRH